VVSVTPRPIDDRDFAEKQFSRQLQYDLVTYNEARAKDDMDPVEGGDVPVSVYTAVQKQKAEPKPDPAAPTPAPANAGGGEGGGPTAGAVPSPDNPAAEGSRPPSVAKSLAASSLSDPSGGLLVGSGRKRRKKSVRRFVSRCLDALPAPAVAKSVPAAVYAVPAPRQEPPVVNVTVQPQAAPVVNVTVPPAEAPTVNLTVEGAAPRATTRTAKRGADGTWTVTDTDTEGGK
jgi:hypothetical protein